MKALIISFLFLTASCSGVAQTCGTIKKAYAYYNVSMPGMQMADEKGNPIEPKPNITRFIYVEYSGPKMPNITAILYGTSALSFSVVNIKEKTVVIGDKNLNPNNSITAKKGNSLLKIDLAPVDGKTMPDADCKSITIKCKVAGRLCRFYITNEKKFESPPTY